MIVNVCPHDAFALVIERTAPEQSMPRISGAVMAPWSLIVPQPSKMDPERWER